MFQQQLRHYKKGGKKCSGWPRFLEHGSPSRGGLGWLWGCPVSEQVVCEPGCQGAQQSEWEARGLTQDRDEGQMMLTRQKVEGRV